MIGEILLLLALVFTVGHMLLDLRGLTLHLKHRHGDAIWTVFTLVFLLGHVLFTGEAIEWGRFLLP